MILLCDEISISLYLRKDPAMTKNEFISLASKHGISVSELSGHLYLTVLDSEVEGWKCETDQYKDEVMKWLLSFHPHEVLLDFISDVVPEEETDEVALFVTDWLLRHVFRTLPGFQQQLEREF